MLLSAVAEEQELEERDVYRVDSGFQHRRKPTEPPKIQLLLYLFSLLNCLLPTLLISCTHGCIKSWNKHYGHPHIVAIAPLENANLFL